MRYLTPNPLNILEHINNNDVRYTTTIVTSNYTIQESDSIIICNNTGPIQITLPAINNNIIERLFIIYKAGTGPVTITTSLSNTIFLDSVSNYLSSLIIHHNERKYLLLIPKDNNKWYVIDNLAFQRSGLHGYVCGGYNGSTYLSTIDRFQFPFSGGSAIQVGNLSGSRGWLSANNSSIHGYVCGGYLTISIIDRFQFPFDSGNAIQVGNLSGGRFGLSANNSSIHGYVCGGSNGSSYFSTVDRFQFPFNSGNTMDVSNLSGSRIWLSANDDTFIPNVMY